MVRSYLVTGLHGQVVRSLVDRSTLHPQSRIIPIGRPAFDLGRIETIEPAIMSERPDLIISAGAYTAVDQAESDEQAAFAVNATAVGEIGRVAGFLGIPVIHLSTDYVFDGEKTTLYVESDSVNPLGVYGRSKLEGERLLAASGADHVILRTAWIYSPFGNNFLKTMLRLAETRDEVSVVADQVGNPTSALDIADAILKVAKNLLSSDAPRLRGIFHLSGIGNASWAEFAEEIFAQSKHRGGPIAKVNRITTAEYPTRVRRPKSSCLNCGRLLHEHNVSLSEWQTSTSDVIRRLLTA